MSFPSYTNAVPVRMPPSGPSPRPSARPFQDNSHDAARPPGTLRHLGSMFEDVNRIACHEEI